MYSKVNVVPIKFVRWCLCLLNLVQLLCSVVIFYDIHEELLRIWEGDVLEIVNLY
jgi:hypothetical protein